MSNCTCGTCDGCKSAMDDFLCDALCEAQTACSEIGATLTFYLRNETHVERDRYRSIKDLQKVAGITLEICGQNIEYQPSRRRLERAGLIEEAEASVWTPTKEWIDASIDFKDIDITRVTVELAGETYQVGEKGRAEVVVGTTPLYYTFGLVKGR